MVRLLVFMILLVTGCAARQGVEEESVETRQRIEVIAHRGASGTAPENTMAAFEQALEVGAHRIELDVQLTLDGQVVILHDATVDRTTDGEGVLSELTFEEVSRLDAGSWFSDAFVDEGVPRLDEVLQWAAGRIHLNIELKIRGGGEPALALTRAASRLVATEGVERVTLYSSFDPVAATEAARLCPECDVALLWNGRTEPDPMTQIEQTGASALHLPLGALDPELVREAQAQNLLIRVYTVNTEDDLERALEASVDGVFTDYPGDVLGWLGAAEPGEE